MRQKLSGFIASAVALMLSLGGVPGRAAAQTAAPTVQQHYTMVDLTPAGATTATAVGLSGAQQFGNASFPSVVTPGTTENHAVLFSNGAGGFTDLGVGTAYGVGDGQQVGYSTFRHAAPWSGTPESFIDLNPVGWDTSVAMGVAGGQQVGTANRRQVCSEKKGVRRTDRGRGWHGVASCPRGPYFRGAALERKPSCPSVRLLQHFHETFATTAKIWANTSCPRRSPAPERP